MLPRHFAALALVIITVMVTGCAGMRQPPAPVSAAVPLSEGLAGTWRGSHGQVAASLYTDNARWVVHIDDDGAFRATVTPSSGANNRAKASAWSGSVTASEHRPVLRSDARWGRLTFTRADDTLYGLETDPFTGVPVMIELEREGPAMSTRSQSGS
jgi:hypothetical protein